MSAFNRESSQAHAALSSRLSRHAKALTTLRSELMDVFTRAVALRKKILERRPEQLPAYEAERAKLAAVAETPREEGILALRQRGHVHLPPDGDDASAGAEAACGALGSAVSSGAAGHSSRSRGGSDAGGLSSGSRGRSDAVSGCSSSSRLGDSQSLGTSLSRVRLSLTTATGDGGVQVVALVEMR